MAKPTTSFTVRASDDNFTTGPAALIGTPTKFNRTALQIAEGWVADEKPACQHWNGYDFDRDQWTKWVTEGSAGFVFGERIVETNATGQTSIHSIRIGGQADGIDEPSFFNPNQLGGEAGLRSNTGFNKPGAILETADDLLPAIIIRPNALINPVGQGFGIDPGMLRIEQVTDSPIALHIDCDSLFGAAFIDVRTSLAVGLRIQAGPGELAVDGAAGLHCIGGTTNGGDTGGLAALFNTLDTTADLVKMEGAAAANGDILIIDGHNRSKCIIATQDGGKSPTVILTSANGGADRAAPLVLTPQNFSVAGEGASSNFDGSIWIQTDTIGGGDDQFHPRLFAESNSRWISWTDGPTCSIDVYGIGIINGPVSDAWFEVGAGIFADKMTPIVAGSVVITIKGRVERANQADTILSKNGADLRVVDVTDSNTVIFSESVDLSALSAIGVDKTIESRYEEEFIYSLPLAGGRHFKVEFRRKVGESGSLKVTNPTIRVRPLPSAQDPA